MGRLTRILAVLITAVSVFAWTGAPTAQAAGKTLVLVDSFDIGDWDPSIYYSDEVRILLNVYETLVHYRIGNRQGVAVARHRVVRER